MTEDTARSRLGTPPWVGLFGLVLPLAIVGLFIVPWFRSNSERADWVRVEGIARDEVDLDHWSVTYAFPGGSDRTDVLPVMRTVEEGDVVELYYPRGHPELLRQDRSGFVLPYVVAGIFAATITGVTIRRYVVGVRSASGLPER